MLAHHKTVCRAATLFGGKTMNWDRIEGNWKQFRGNVQQQWGKLTDDHLNVVAGKRDQLAGKIQEVYGISRDEVNKQLSAWQKLQKDITAPAPKSTHRTHP
jgi:uncharacterized protein YjbJ (UPF0337 family)